MYACFAHRGARGTLMAVAVFQSRHARWQTVFGVRRADLVLRGFEPVSRQPPVAASGRGSGVHITRRPVSDLSRRVVCWVVGFENHLRLGRHNSPRLEQRNARVAVVPRRVQQGVDFGRGE
jgi:hypothetical protein